MTEIVVDDRIDRMIWKGIGRKSVRQMAKETGLTVEQVAQRRTELVEGVDEITIQQMRAKLLVDAQDIASTAREDYDDEPDKDKGSKLLTVALGAIKTVLDQLNRMEKASTTAIDELNSLRVRELVSLIQEAVDTSVPEIAELYGIDKDALFQIFNANLGKAAMKRDLE